MAEVEKVDLVKAIKGPTTGVFWVKTIMYLLAASAIVFLFLAVKNFIHPKPTQNITMQEGSQLTIRNEAAKRHLIMFAEPYFAVSTEDKADVGCRVGVRWEF